MFESKSIKKGYTNQNTFHNFPTVINKKNSNCGNLKSTSHEMFPVSEIQSCVKHFKKTDSKDTLLTENVINCRVLRHIAHPSLFSKGETSVNDLPFMSTKNNSLEPCLCLV